MSFSWLHYTELANHLFASPFSGYQEACYRSAVSRAYYGVFCHCRNEARLKDYRPRSNADLGTHQKVIRHYKDSLEKKYKDIGVKLDELRRLRNKADYDGDNPIKKNDVEQALFVMSEIINTL